MQEQVSVLTRQARQSMSSASISMPGSAHLMFIDEKLSGVLPSS